MKKALPTLIGFLVLAAVGFLASRAFLARADAARAEEPPAPRPVTVEIAPIAMEEALSVRRRFTGVVQARRKAELSFEGSGRVTEVLVEEGQRVEAGEVLARLDAAVLRASRAEVASRRERLQAQLEELEAGPRAEAVDAARAEVAALEEELALAVLQRDRRKGLAERGTIGVEQLDAARALVDTTDARLRAARARLAELENGSRPERIAAQRGALGEIAAGLDAIDVQIEKTTLRAPFAGTISMRLVDEGAVVSVQMPAVAFHLVESTALEVRTGLPPEIADALSSGGLTPILRARGAELAVRSTRILPTVDVATRTVAAIFELDSAPVIGDSDARVRDGDVATLEVSLERRERGAWVPLAALSESTRGLWSLFRVVATEGTEGPVVERLELEVLHVDGERAFVRGTVAGDERIVVTGAHRLVPGQRVRPVERFRPAVKGGQ